MKLLLEIPLLPSRFSFWLHVFLLFSVWLAILLCGFSFTLQGVLIVLAAMLIVRGWNNQRKNWPDKIHYNTKGWFIERHGKRIKVEPVGEWVVLPWLVVMNFKKENNKQRCGLSLWWDAVKPEDLRRLRALIRNLPSDSP